MPPFLTLIRPGVGAPWCAVVYVRVGDSLSPVATVAGGWARVSRAARLAWLLAPPDGGRKRLILDDRRELRLLAEENPVPAKTPLVRCRDQGLEGRPLEVASTELGDADLTR